MDTNAPSAPGTSEALAEQFDISHDLEPAGGEIGDDGGSGILRRFPVNMSGGNADLPERGSQVQGVGSGRPHHQARA